MLKKLYEHCKSDVAATNNKEFRRTLQYTVKCDICDMCCKILHSPFLIHRRVPSESDILRYIQACRASAIYGIAIYWRYTHKRVPALAPTHMGVRLKNRAYLPVKDIFYNLIWSPFTWPRSLLVLLLLKIVSPF